MVLRRDRSGSDSMPGRSQTYDFEFAGVELRKADGGFVGLATCAEEEGFVQSWWGEGCEALGERDYGRGEHAGEEVVELLGVRVDCADDFGVAVAD